MFNRDTRLKTDTVRSTSRKAKKSKKKNKPLVTSQENKESNLNKNRE